MTNRRITEEQFESGSAIDGARIQKALNETEEYFNNIPLEAVKQKYSLNYMVFTSLNANISYAAADPTTMRLNQPGFFHYSPFLPGGSHNRVKGQFREERTGVDSINGALGQKSKTYRIFTVSAMFDRPIILDSVSLFMMNKLPDSTVVTPPNASSIRYQSDQKYTMRDSAGRSKQRTRILIETDDIVSSEDRTLNSKEFVLQDFQEKFWPAEGFTAAVATMFPETSESPTGKFMENQAHEGMYLLKENINLPIHQRSRVRFRVISYAEGNVGTTDMLKDIKPENMTFTVVYKEALISG